MHSAQTSQLNGMALVAIHQRARGTDKVEMLTQPQTEIQRWNIDRLVFYARNPRKKDAAVDRICGSIGCKRYRVQIRQPDLAST
jgi:hypothetical protein